MNRGFLLIGILQLLFLQKFSAQSFSFRYYNEENGLAHNYIYAISQSERGHLYLSAGEALYRYDGKSFHVFNNENFRKNFVSTHYVDASGRVWIGHNQNGISVLRGETIRHISHPSINSAKVTGFFEQNNKVYVASNGAGLFVTDTSLVLEPVRTSGVSHIVSLCNMGRKAVLLGTPEGLLLAEFKSYNDLAIIRNIDALEGLSVKQVVLGKTPGVVWVLTEYDGVFILNFQGSQFLSCEELNGEIDTRTPVSNIYEDDDNNLWLSIPGEGVKKVSFSGLRYTRQKQVFSFGTHNGLRSLYIQSIYQDREGNMWFGSFGEGLIQKLRQKFSFYGEGQGLKDLDIQKVVTDTNGNLWLGTSGGLFYYVPENNKRTPAGAGAGFKSVSALLLDTAGGLWAGTDKGLFFRSATSDKFDDCFKKLKIAPMQINCLIENKGQILCGTPEGIIEVGKDLAEVRHLTTNDGLLHNNIVHLYHDSKGRIWVSSHGTPLYYFRNGKMKVFKDLSGRTSFNYNVVYEDATGNIWIGTEGDGAFKYDGKTFEHFDHSRGLVSDYCSGIAEDGAGSIWITHKSGLSEKTSLSSFFSPITERSGLLYPENNHDAVHRDPDGDLWFGTAGGLVHYEGGEANGGAFRPKVHIETLKFNDQAVSLQEKVEMKYGNYAIRLEFQAISFSHQLDMIYRYRLLGVDSAWKETGMSYIDIPRLSDGDYRFEVYACVGHSGLCSSDPAIISFSIKKPVWKNIWFYLAVAAILFLSTYIIIRLRTQRLRSMQHLLQLKVKQKTFLLQREKEAVEKIKGELEKRNKDITDSINYAKNIQDSILPPDEMLEELFGRNYFVLYKPKDIVSGDFYWAAALNVNNNNKKDLALAAVIDCTGHGVPGAFLSIMANDFLKQSIISRNVNNTNEILNFLNEEVSSHLNQSQSKRMMDGMDISLIGIDSGNRKLYYSGANNPVYIYRQVDGITQTFILKGTKQAIGQDTGILTHYDVQLFDLQQGDTIYLFSDGFADQFGGSLDKKLTYRRFREILEQAFLMPIEQQKRFLEEQFNAWKKDNEQTDDVCVMGIRVAN